MTYSYNKYIKAFKDEYTNPTRDTTLSNIKIWSMNYWHALPENKGLLPPIKIFNRFAESVFANINSNFDAEDCNDIVYTDTNEDDNEGDSEDDNNNAEYLTKDEYKICYKNNRN